MEVHTIDTAERSARIFLQRVADLHKAVREDKSTVSGSRQSGALRRASMDLTRALADMRRPV